jgi:hypothetical protein
MAGRLLISVSFVPRQGFVAHHYALPVGLPANTVRGLRERVAAVQPDAAIVLQLTRTARAELDRRAAQNGALR